MKRLLTIIFSVAASVIMLHSRTAAISPDENSGLPDIRQYFIINENILGANKIKLDSVRNPHLDERVIVGGDTISIILPQKNYGRYDRGLYNFLFIPKGQWSFGLTASYGEFNTDDVEILSILKDFDIKVKAYSLKPSISYFFRNNQSIGIKFDYTRSNVDLANMTFDFDDDINFTLKDVSYYSQSYSASINYRNYIGLGAEKRFAIFNEIDLGFGSGSSRFKRTIGGTPRDTRTNITTASLNFSPGVCVYIMDNVSFNVSFGVFGLKMRNEKQITDGEIEGSRFTSGANFRFNIFNINFGLAVNI